MKNLHIFQLVECFAMCSEKVINKNSSKDDAMQHAVLPVLALIKRNTFSLAYNLIFINHNVRSRNFSVYGKNQLISPITSAYVVFSAVCKNIFVKYYYVSSSISCTHVSSKGNKYALFSETVKLEGQFFGDEQSIQNQQYLLTSIKCSKKGHVLYNTQ